MMERRVDHAIWRRKAASTANYQNFGRRESMADLEGEKETKNFFLDVPCENKAFFLRGAGALDWGMQNRLAKIFSPASGRTVMLAIDHGYFQGPTTGLERVDVGIVPLLPYTNALMLTRGILRTTIPPTFSQGVVLRASGGPSILKELSNEEIAMDVDDAVRLNACAMAVQVFVGGECETQSIHNMTRLVDAGLRYGIATLGVTAVGKDMVRNAKYFRLACRICAELGAQVVKTYYVPEGFETITASCPVPVVMAGGKKLPELEALTMAYRAVSEGAAGVDMGRNIFQSDAPAAMIQTVGKVVHELMNPEQAYDLYQTLRHETAGVRS
jgi:putative autoinducer-2 (AI-2) aldolase